MPPLNYSNNMSCTHS